MSSTRAASASNPETRLQPLRYALWKPCHPDRSRSASDGAVEGPAVLPVLRKPSGNPDREASVESHPSKDEGWGTRLGIYAVGMYLSSQLKYSDILHDLHGLDDWLSALGVPVRSMDRAHYAVQKLEKAQQAHAEGLEKGAGVSRSDYLFALTEALELRDVYKAFKDHPPDQLRERLTRALSGPPLPEAETKKNRDGRNVMFELALGAEWALLGGKVEFLEPDLALRIPHRSYLVACKRPENDHGIRAAVKDAASQLRSALGHAKNDNFGIVAVSLSRILNRGNTYFSGTYEQLSRILNDLMAVHRQDWRTTDFHPRNIAILFYAHTPANWGDGLYRLSAMRIVQAFGDFSENHRSLQSDMSKLYAVPA
jgi:hypothetical protein